MYDEMHHDVRAPKPWIRWLLLIVILSATLVIGYVLGSMQSQPQDFDSTEAVSIDSGADFQEETGISTAAVDDLETFTSSNHGYSIQYPRSWSYETNYTPDMNETIVRIFEPEQAKLSQQNPEEFGLPYCTLEIYAFDNFGQLPGNEPGAQTIEEWASSLEDSTLLFNQTKTTVAGKTAFMGQELGILNRYSVFMANSDRPYRVSTCTDATSFTEKQQQVIDLFKFL